MQSITRTQLALMLHSVPHLGSKGIARLISELPPGLPNEQIELDDIKALTLSAGDLRREYKLRPKAADHIASRKQKLLLESRKAAYLVQKLGIRVLITLDPDYPTCLKEYEINPAPIIYTYGNLSLLRERKFAVVSSSGVQPQGIGVTRGLAGILCSEGLTAVTSHNTQAYKAMELAARSGGFPVIFVLDRGIMSAFHNGLDWEPVSQARIWNIRFDPKRDLIVSKFRLQDAWIGANGMERDRMVFALADVVIAVEVRPGGVMEKECLHAHKKGREVYVYMPESGEVLEGNKGLLEKGCRPIPVSWARSVLATLDLPSDQTDSYE